MVEAVGTVGMVWPPPRFRTLMEESVRSATERVPVWVGLSLPGGGREVKSGSQRMSPAEVSWLAMRSCGGVPRAEAEFGRWTAVGEVDSAVFGFWWGT